MTFPFQRYNLSCLHLLNVVVNPPDEYLTSLFLSFLNCVLPTPIFTASPSSYIFSNSSSKAKPSMHSSN
ncbi:hypothetical protein LSH36_63g04017 [Paralvinella palmiformis]|uniref:Uncharacterized protein n=1 Tax=Paralvinella palmiformis TaxID=53620 RepID=A0AAD9K5D0_9ANNE|nr:hypothetical protein LSH36_63g04017 [Paralvinella palmiformis]